MQESVLVTGGAGYVGAHVVVELAQAGFVPVVLDDYSNSGPAVRTRLEALAGRPVPCINADVRDIAALRAAFHDHPIGAVVHCAGLKSVAEAEARPLAYYDVNVGGTLALVEVMGEAGVASLVYTSSAAVRDLAEPDPDAGANPPRTGVYARTVRVVEDFLRDLAHANANWRIAALRVANVAGAHASGMLGASPRGRPADLVTVLARAAAGDGGDVPLCGADWPTKDRTARRDYVHVQDVARAHVRALGGLAGAHGISVHDVGSGAMHSVRDVIAAFEQACMRKIGTRPMERRAGDVAERSGGAPGGSSLVDAPPRDLATICADAWRWQRNGGRY